VFLSLSLKEAEMKAVLAGLLVAAIATSAMGVTASFTLSSTAASSYLVGTTAKVAWSVAVSVPDDGSNAGLAAWEGQLVLLKSGVQYPLTLPKTSNGGTGSGDAASSAMFGKVFRVGGATGKVVSQPGSFGGNLTGGPGLTIFDKDAPNATEPGKLFGFGSSYPTAYVPLVDNGDGTWDGSASWGVGLAGQKIKLLGSTAAAYKLVDATLKTGSGAYDNRISLSTLPVGTYELRWVPTGTHKVLNAIAPTNLYDGSDPPVLLVAAGQPIDWDVYYGGNVSAQAADAVGSSVFFNITPEPATMLLLGVPALFIRRRRA